MAADQCHGEEQHCLACQHPKQFSKNAGPIFLSGMVHRLHTDSRLSPADKTQQRGEKEAT
jgi:hypothetical protein